MNQKASQNMTLAVSAMEDMDRAEESEEETGFTRLYVTIAFRSPDLLHL